MIKQGLLLIIFVMIMAIQPYKSYGGLSANAVFNYGETTSGSGGTTIKTDFLNEIYRLSLSKRLTKLIIVSGTVAHIRRDVDGLITEDTFPSVSISFRPPRIYTLNMGFGRNDYFPDNGIHSSTSNMFATMVVGI